MMLSSSHDADLRAVRASIWLISAGAVLLALFVFLFVLALDRGPQAADSIGTILKELRALYYPVLIPALVIVAGMLGAYSQLMRDLVAQIALERRSDARRLSASSPAAIHLAVGGLLGFVAGLVLPSAILRENVGVDVFNPAALSLLSAAAGCIGVQYSSTFVDRIADLLGDARSPLDSKQMTEVIQKALASPPLVNYDGYLVCAIHTPRGSAMDGVQAYVGSETQLHAELKLTPTKPERGVSTRVLVNQGIDPSVASSEPVFHIEVAADDIETPETRQMPVSGGSSSATIPLRLSPDASSENELKISFYVSQAGRHISSLKIPIRRSQSISSTPRVETASTP